MYSIQGKMNNFKSFRFSLAKKLSSSNFKLAPAKKPRLRPAPAPHHCEKQLVKICLDSAPDFDTKHLKI